MATAWRERRGASFIVRYRDKNGGPKKTAGTYPNAPAADAEVARINGAIDGRVDYPGQLLPIDELARAYTKARLAAGAMRAGNAATCVSVVTKHAKAQEWATVVDVTPTALQAWWSSASTIGAWRHLRAVLRWAAFSLDQPVDPRILNRAPTPRRQGAAEPELMPIRLVKKALSRAKPYPHCHALLHWVATYGCRPVTLMHMVVGDVDLRTATVSIAHNKNGKAYRHPLTAASVALLRPLMTRRKPTERLFLDPRTGEPWEFSISETANRISEWYRVWVAHDFPPEFRGPYVLKDHAISHMVRAGMDDETIAKFTGHLGSVAMARYKKSNLELARAAIGKLSQL